MVKSHHTKLHGKVILLELDRVVICISTTKTLKVAIERLAPTPIMISSCSYDI